MSREGLKVGFEFHQQLDTEEKLFCSCPTEKREPEEADYRLYRELQPTESELGEVDRAALEEARKERSFEYLGFDDTTCLVEDDEEPPQTLDEEALELALKVSLMMEAQPLDRVEVMRKIVIDGSNTAGFQRTALVSMGGEVETSEGPVRIDSISLEEESAQKQEEKEEVTVYSLDRLGIPLVEVGTRPDISSPEQAAEFAEKVGTIFRSTGDVKRGIGTIRQDVNVSIPEGARVELKGAQELDLMEDYVEREVQRQEELVEIAEELEWREVDEVEFDPVDVSALFEDTESSVLRGALESGGSVHAFLLEGFDGLLGREVQPDRRLGTELSDRAKLAGVGGIFHTDELPAYGITEEETEALRQELGAGEEDAVVMTAGSDEECLDALERAAERAEEALDGVPEETRRPLPDGNSEYMRPLPGAARMYPETDVPSVVVEEEHVEELREELPELIPVRRERFQEEYGLNADLARQMARSKLSGAFEQVVDRLGVDPVLAVRTLLHYPKEHDADLSADRLKEVLREVAEGDLTKEAVPKVIEALKETEESVESVVQDLGLTGISEEEVRGMVRETLEEREDFAREKGMGAIGPLMGPVMGKVQGRMEGEEVNRILREELQDLLDEE